MIARSRGVDVSTGKGLDDALIGVDAVIDASSAGTNDLRRLARTAVTEINRSVDVR